MDECVAEYRRRRNKERWAEWWAGNKDECIAQAKHSGQNLLELAQEAFHENTIRFLSKEELGITKVKI